MKFFFKGCYLPLDDHMNMILRLFWEANVDFVKHLIWLILSK